MSLDPGKRCFARSRYVRKKDGWEGTILVVLPSRKCRPDSVIQPAMVSSLHMGRHLQPMETALRSDCLRSLLIPGVLSACWDFGDRRSPWVRPMSALIVFKGSILWC